LVKIILEERDDYLLPDAAGYLTALGWTPNTQEEVVVYLVARHDREAMVKMGPVAFPYLTKILKDRYDVNVAIALGQLDWEPVTEEEKIAYFIAIKDEVGLHANWAVTKRVLLVNANSGDPYKVDIAVRVIMGLGQEDGVDVLINILDNHGTKKIAEMYLNCGHPRLADAAGDWAFRHGYAMFTSGGGDAGVTWGVGYGGIGLMLLNHSTMVLSIYLKGECS
jgi:hypothetical protein